MVSSSLKNGLKGNPYYYMDTWKSYTNDYSEATQALQGAYATDSNYAEKLNRIISKHHLTEFDQRKIEVPSKYIVVREGDTLSNIAKEFHITTDQLFIWNELQSNEIKKDSKLVVQVTKKLSSEPVSVKEVKRNSEKRVNKYKVKKGSQKRIETSIIKNPRSYKTVRSTLSNGKKIYQVKNGDSIMSISKRFKIDEKEIMTLNKLDSSFVYEGQRLIIQ